jgi:hypothetical protein
VKWEGGVGVPLSSCLRVFNLEEVVLSAGWVEKGQEVLGAEMVLW